MSDTQTGNEQYKAYGLWDKAKHWPTESDRWHRRHEHGDLEDGWIYSITSHGDNPNHGLFRAYVCEPNQTPPLNPIDPSDDIMMRACWQIPLCFDTLAEARAGAFGYFQALRQGPGYPDPNAIKSIHAEQSYRPPQS